LRLCVITHALCRDTAPPELYTLSLHDALPILRGCACLRARRVFRSSWATTTSRSTAGVAREWSTSTSSRRIFRQRRSSSWSRTRSEEHTSELQSRENLVCRLLLEKKKTITSKT